MNLRGVLGCRGPRVILQTRPARYSTRWTRRRSSQTTWCEQLRGWLRPPRSRWQLTSSRSSTSGESEPQSLRKTRRPSTRACPLTERRYWRASDFACSRRCSRRSAMRTGAWSVTSSVGSGSQATWACLVFSPSGATTTSRSSSASGGCGRTPRRSARTSSNRPSGRRVTRRWPKKSGRFRWAKPSADGFTALCRPMRCRPWSDHCGFQAAGLE